MKKHLPARLFTIALLHLLMSSLATATCELIPFKNQNFGGLELIRACNILPCDAIEFPGIDLCELCAGLPQTPPQEPLVNLITHDMLYFNWKIPVQNVPFLEATLQAAIGFSDRGFSLAPIALLKGEEPAYYMSLNFYSVVIAGEINYRSEWSTYVVRDGDPKPRFMVLEVQSNADSADPLSPGFNNPANPDVMYIIDNGQVTVANTGFSANFMLPNVESRPRRSRGQPGSRGKPYWTGSNGAKVSSAWAQANDYLYYLNGVADTALYNGALTDIELVSVNPADASVINNGNWSGFVSGDPDHIVYFSKPLEFAFTPYFNLFDPTLGLDPGYVEALNIFKTYTFGAFSYGHAFLVLQGLEEPLLRFDVPTDNVPSIFINFNIKRNKVRALEEMLNLPDGFSLAQSKARPDQRERYLISLNIYESPDVLTGQRSYRAEWSVYVKDADDPEAKGPYLMVIDVDSNSPSLDPYNLYTPPTGFSYTNANGRLMAEIEYLDTSKKFSFAFDMPSPDTTPVKLDEAWILANDRIYWRNGVYDLLFYNGLLLDADVIQADPESVEIDDRTPWATFVDPLPTEVLIFRTPLQFVLHPWYNVEERCYNE